MALYYTPGMGYSSTQPYVYTNASGQRVVGYSGLHNDDGSLAKMKIHSDGQTHEVGTSKGGFAINGLKSATSNGGSAPTAVANSPSYGSAQSLIAKWKSGQSLSAAEREIVRQYLMRQGTYIAQDQDSSQEKDYRIKADIEKRNNEAFGQSMSSYMSGAKQQASAIPQVTGGGAYAAKELYPGQSTGKNRYKKLTGGGVVDLATVQVR